MKFCTLVFALLLQSLSVCGVNMSGLSRHYHDSSASKFKLNFHNEKEQKFLMIDTDAGSDDGVAILNFLSAENLGKNVKTVLITTVFGNTEVENVGINVLKVLKTMNRLDIPVFKGSNESLLKRTVVGDYFGKDGFGDFIFPDPPSPDLIKKKHAVNALIEAASVNPGNLSLVSLGPLTNIALAIKLDPHFLDNLKEIYVLGGSDSGVGNPRPGIEFNFDMDPHSAFIVFKETEKRGKIINLMTWETVFRRSKIEMSWRKNILGVLKSPMVDLINKAERKLLKGKYWHSADTYLSSIVLDETIIESAETYHVDVETCGQFADGALFVDYSFNPEMKKNARLIKKINTVGFKKMLLENFKDLQNETIEN